MNCDTAANLLNARIDGEIDGDDDIALDAHLAGCEACRRQLAQMELQDASLLRAFARQRENAIALGARVSQQLERTSIAGNRRLNYFNRAVSLATAATVGFLASALLFHFSQSFHKSSPPIRSITADFRPIAHVTLATGRVFTCSDAKEGWREITSNQAVEAGAGIRTAGQSACELKFDDGSCVRLNSGTEAHFTGNRSIQVSAGQVWSAVAQGAAPLRVSAGDTSVVTNKTNDGSKTQFQMNCVAHTAAVSVECGSAEVAAKQTITTVHAGEILNPPAPDGVFTCTTIPDPISLTQWQDQLLVLKGPDDAEVRARLEGLLIRIAGDRKRFDVPQNTELNVRALGPAWCPAIASVLRAHSQVQDDASRKIGAQLLADFAMPASIPDLIEFLADVDRDVRFQSAVGLHRLTGVTLGYSPEQCAEAQNSAAAPAWLRWWGENKTRYADDGK